MHKTLNSQPIILHCHIFKNAGTSIITAFKNIFGSNAVEIEPPNENQTLSILDIENYLKDNPNTLFISSHKIKLPLPEFILGRKVIPIILFRDPMNRLASVYRFEKKEGRSGILSFLAKSKSFNNFLTTLMNCGYKKIICNPQSQYLNLNPNQNPNQNQKSIENLFSECKIGLVERYEEYLRSLECDLKQWFPNIKLAAYRENVTQSNSQSLNSIDSLVYELTPQITRDLLESNELDRLIYKLANKKMGPSRNYNNPSSFSLSEEIYPSELLLKDLNKNDLMDKSIKTPYDKADFFNKNNWLIINKKCPNGIINFKKILIGEEDIGESPPRIEPGEDFLIEVEVEWIKPVHQPIIGFTIKKAFSEEVVWCINSEWTDFNIPEIKVPMICNYKFSCKLPQLIGGVYSVDIDSATGTLGEHKMLFSTRMAGIFYVPNATELVPGGSVFVSDVKLGIERT